MFTLTLNTQHLHEYIQQLLCQLAKLLIYT